MKTRKFFFYFGIFVFLFAACGADNGGNWLTACFIGLGMSWASVRGCTKRQLVYIFDYKKKRRDYNI